MDENFAAFPEPPNYFKSYDSQNDTPPPPPKPITGEYKNFGKVFTTDLTAPTLSNDHNIKELFKKGPLTNVETIVELQKLLRSLVWNFHEFVSIMKDNPCSVVEEDEEMDVFVKNESSSILKPAYLVKANQIYLIMTNMSFLLNSLRGYQSKNKLIGILEKQLEKRKEVRERIEKTLKECQEELKKHLEEIKKEKNEGKKHKKRAREEEIFEEKKVGKKMGGVNHLEIPDLIQREFLQNFKKK